MPGTSTPLSASGTRAALAKYDGHGYHLHYVDGWETRNRGDRGNGWGPVYGFMVHHTGDDAPDSADLNVCIYGRSDLPGPLVQFGIADDGGVYVIGCGRANHAGLGDSRVLAAVRDESYDTRPPAPTLKDWDGNGSFYGVETFYSGYHVPTPAQYAAMLALSAAICDAQGWTGKSVIGHGEWVATKWDPGKVDMPSFRYQVDRLMAQVNSGTGADMPLDSTDLAKIKTVVDQSITAALPRIALAVLAYKNPTADPSGEDVYAHIVGADGPIDLAPVTEQVRTAVAQAISSIDVTLHVANPTSPA